MKLPALCFCIVAQVMGSLVGGAMAAGSPTIPEVCFAWLPPPPQSVTVAPGEGRIEKSMLGREVSLSGHLHDTGALNLFYVSAYDGFRIRSQRLYVKGRALQDPQASVWCRVEARISAVDPENQDHNEIDIGQRTDLDVKSLAAAQDDAARWVARRRTTVELNEFKKSERFKRLIAGGISETANLNLTPYRKMREIHGVDTKRGVAEFLCGRHVLAEVPDHHAHFLDLVVVYDLKKRRVIRLIVENTGYFLE